MVKYSDLKKGDILKVIGVGSSGFVEAGSFVIVIKTYFDKVRVEDKYGNPGYFERHLSERLEKTDYSVDNLSEATVNLASHLYKFADFNKAATRLGKKELLPARVRRLMIFNAKGGVGKTAIALNLALTYGYGVITNDRISVVDQVLPGEQCRILSKDEKLPELDESWPIIFDFGGYPDKRAVEALKTAQFVLIPILAHKENVQTSLNIIQEISGYKKSSEIILIINQTTGKQYEEISEAFKRFYPELKIFNLKKSAAFAWMNEHKTSIEELCLRHKFHARHFQPVAEQFNMITEHLLKIKKNENCK